MKLYANEKKELEIGAVVKFASISDPDTVNTDITSLEEHVKAYNSLNTVYNQVASEEFSFIDKGNYILYNEYITSITSRLGVKPVIISQEAIDTIPTIALNHHISLEGFIKDMWDKIKGLFSKIYESIKTFFTKYFTRLGRLKNKLNNLKEVLNETDKDISTLNLDSVPSSLASKYPVNGDISLNTIETIFNNVSSVGNILKKINEDAINLAKKEIMDKDFVSKIKNLKDLAKDSKDKIDENNKGKKFALPFTEQSKKNSEINKDNKTLKETANNAESQAKKEEGKAVSIGDDSSNAGVEFDDTKFLAAQKEFESLITSISNELNKLKNKPLINGKTITSVKVDKESGIDLETDTNKETPTEIRLGGKGELLKLIDNTIKLVESVESVSKNYGEINDTVMKNMDTVDKLIKDIDAINMDSLGKYKTVLSNKVKERLNLLKTFFTNYNKVNKSLFEIVLDTADGSVEYAVLSLKYFG